MNQAVELFRMVQFGGLVNLAIRSLVLSSTR